MNYPVERQAPAAAPGRIGQGTAVEQSRAVAEVQAAIVVAQQVPRDINAAIAEMRQSCQQLFLAERAFFRYSRGSGNITGASVHLARELARCWGNIQYGLVEMRRDDEYAQSEMQAFAWDLQTNARSASIFIQPHRMDTKRGPKILTEVQAIYESNANAGARRVREAIFAVLPADFVDEAQELCHATLAKGDGSPLEERRTKAIGAFEKTFGVTEQQLVDRIGRAVSRWDAEDVAALQVLYRSLQSREVLVEVEFPKAETTVTAEEIAARSQAARKPAETPGPDPRDEDRTAEYVQAMAEDGAS